MTKSLDTLMEAFKPGRDKEKPRDDLCEKSYENWMRIHADVRRQVVNHIRALATVDQLNTWRDQHARGMRIGSDDPYFHFGSGMMIRNACRKIILDDQLWPVKYDDGGHYQNWDDYYGGMLQQLAHETYE